MLLMGLVLEVPRDTSPLWRWHPHRGGAGLTRVMGAKVLARRQSGIHRFRCSGVLIVSITSTLPFHHDHHPCRPHPHRRRRLIVVGVFVVVVLVVVLDFVIVIVILIIGMIMVCWQGTTRVRPWAQAYSEEYLRRLA